MKLIGNYLSPYTRRVAISLNTLGIPFELEELSPFKKPEAIREHNPLVRIPTLILGDGETVFESHVILDVIDQLVGPEMSLTPSKGKQRRDVLKVTAVGTASMDKTVWAFYEGRFHPPEKVHQPWIEHNEKQILGGLGYLDTLARSVSDGGWIAGTDKISQADITCAVAYSFARAVRPNLRIAESVPHLADFARRCEALDTFRAAPVPESLPS